MKLTAIWGSSGGGKSTVALALGANFAKRKDDTLIISTDSCTPSLPLYLPRRTGLTGNQSIGNLLEQKTISESSLKDRIHKHPKCDHLYFMGHISGEAAGVTYRTPERGTIFSLLHLLQGTPFQHVVIDCMSNPIYDGLTLLALEAADAVCQVITPDVKGYEFLKAQLAWLGNSDTFQTDRHIKVSNLAFPFSPLQEAEVLSAGFDVSLPYARQVAERMIAGELLSGFTEPTGIQFEREINQLADRITKEEKQHA